MLNSNKIIIGIPVHNDLESFTEMLNSLMLSTKAFDRIIIIESGSTDGCAEFCDEMNKEEKIEVIHTELEGPLKAYNRLFNIAKERECDLFLTQTDVLFPKLYKRDWLGIMREFAYQQPLGTVISINGGGTSGPDYIDGFKWMGGWCSFYPHEIINKVDGYDESFPNGFGVDIDHTYRINKEDYPVKIMNYWVDHHMMNEREHDKDIDTEKMKRESSEYFKKKWKLIKQINQHLILKKEKNET